jgi:hypothetical protein
LEEDGLALMVCFYESNDDPFGEFMAIHVSVPIA